MPVSAHKKRQSVKFPLDLSVGKNKTYKLKRAIDRPTETGNFCLSNLEYRNFFFRGIDRGIRNPGPWNSTTGIWNSQRGVQNPRLSCPVFLFD